MVDALREMAGLLALVAVVLSIVALIIAARRRGVPADEAAARLAPDPVLDQLLASQMQRLDRIGDEVMAQAGRLRMIEGNARHMVQRVGIVRFNPFEEEGFSPFRDGDRRKFGLSAAGGGDQVTYFISGDLEKEDGIYTSNFLEKYNVRANLRALMRDNLTFNVSTSFTSSDFSQPSNDNSVLSPILNGMFGRARFDRSTPNRAYYSFNPEVTNIAGYGCSAT